jgi:hypothetical protein
MSGVPITSPNLPEKDDKADDDDVHPDVVKGGDVHRKLY